MLGTWGVRDAFAAISAHQPTQYRVHVAISDAAILVGRGDMAVFGIALAILRTGGQQ